MNAIAQAIPESLPMTASEIQTQVNTIQHVMQQVMKDGTHYGKIPGCGDSKSLLKPGAEKIMATFRLSADPIVEDISTADEIRYRVKVRLVSSSGIFVGAGIGECSTSEEKYKWRACYIQQEFDATPEDRRRIKYSQYQQQPVKEIKQVRTNPADLANTVLKMAKKRGLVDAVLTATAASDIFTQDIEDLPDEIRAEIVQNDRQKPANNKPDLLPEYPQESFDAQLPKWKALIESGTKKAMNIIATVSSKYTMTPEQKNKLTSIKPIETAGGTE